LLTLRDAFRYRHSTSLKSLAQPLKPDQFHLGEVCMKKLSALLSAAVIFCVSINVQPQQLVNHGGKIETKYDGFSHQTIMRLQPMKVTCGGFKDNFKDGCVSIDVSLHLPGPQVNHVSQVSLRVIFESRNWQKAHAYDQRELMVVTDLDTMRLGRMRLVPKGDTTMDETMVETLEATMPYEAFKKIAVADNVQFQVGPSRIELREKNRAALRDLSNRVITATSKN
jgi:hypothetical protein